MLNYNISRLVVASVNPSQIGLIRLKSLEFVSLVTCSPSTSKFSGRCYASYTTNKNPKSSQSGKVDASKIIRTQKPVELPKHLNEAISGRVYYESMERKEKLYKLIRSLALALFAAFLIVYVYFLIDIFVTTRNISTMKKKLEQEMKKQKMAQEGLGEKKK